MQIDSVFESTKYKKRNCVFFLWQNSISTMLSLLILLIKFSNKYNNDKAFPTQNQKSWEITCLQFSGYKLFTRIYLFSETT